jgi:hypothetical protein
MLEEIADEMDAEADRIETEERDPSASLSP